MKNIKIYPLGAGREVGRSCILIDFDDKKVLLDCGLHMALTDDRRIPNFDLLKKIYKKDDINDIIDITLISHFHLDHCGALPFLTEKENYNNPIIMTTPTKAIIPYMLEDYSRVIKEIEELKQSYYTSDNIFKCCKKITSVNLHESYFYKDLEIKAYYAGHVLGACMFYIKYKNKSVVYTGDFNSSSDRHLGSCWIDRLKPDILISESTYATTFRDSKKERENEFLNEIQNTIQKGGKVLIPVFALGRAQELCILIELIWKQTNCKIPVYFSAGMIGKVNFFYNLFVNWTNQKIKDSFLDIPSFNFEYIKVFNKSNSNLEIPMVLLATPGMLHGGSSLQIFKEWCSDSKNLLILPGYCVKGTIGNQILNGVKKLNIDNKEYNINMKIKKISFSAHADSRGILNLIKILEPKNVVFVHGEYKKMEFLSNIIKKSFKLPVFYPKNYEFLEINNPIMDIKVNFNQDIWNKKYFYYNKNENIINTEKDNKKPFVIKKIFK